MKKTKASIKAKQKIVSMKVSFLNTYLPLLDLVADAPVMILCEDRVRFLYPNGYCCWRRNRSFNFISNNDITEGHDFTGGYPAIANCDLFDNSCFNHEFDDSYEPTIEKALSSKQDVVENHRELLSALVRMFKYDKQNQIEILDIVPV